VEEKVAITDSRQQQNATVDKTNQETSRDTSSLRTRYSSWEERSTLRTPDNGPLVYSTLTELLQLVEAENRLRMARIETQLLKFCTEVVLPKYQLTQHQ
jgi:transposase-like protein